MVAILLAVLALAVPAWAQTTASLTIDVVDTTGGALPGAVVTLHRADQIAADTTTDASGRAVISARPGRYRLTVSAQAFDPNVRSVDVLANRSVSVRVRLGLSPIEETVTVQAGRATPTENVLDLALLETVGDDPEALATFLREVGGPDAAVHVDGEPGGSMPPTRQVAQVVLTSDPYSAQFHGVGQTQVNVITKPGFGNWYRSAYVNMGDDALGARPPFAPEKPPFRSVYSGASVSGPLARARASIAVDLRVSRFDEQRPALAQTEAGVLRTRTPVGHDQQGIELRLTNVLGTTTILRHRVEVNTSNSFGSGVGDLDLPERAFTNRGERVSGRSTINSTLAHGVLQELRASGSRQVSRRTPVREEATTVVLGAFRAGGAQTRGTQLTSSLQFEGGWTFPRRRGHGLKAGTLLERTHVRSTNLTNYLGTFTFSSLDAYGAGTPLTYSRRLGTVAVDVADLHGAVYVQDDLHLGKRVQLGLGLRQEWQPAIRDGLNLSPRLSLAFSPSSATTFRAGAARFYSWYDSSLLEEAVRLDGQRFQDVLIQNPGYPNPTGDDVTLTSTPSTRLIVAGDVHVSMSWRSSFSVERRFRSVQLKAAVSRQIGEGEPRVRNINVPVAGVRPDDTLGNVLWLTSTGRSQRMSLELTVSTWNLLHNRLNAWAQHTIGESRNDRDGALTLPADNAQPGLEWGPSRGDIRHRGWGSVDLRLRDTITVGLFARWQSAAPYNITTGTDDNGDSTLNDRPAGLGRNAGRGRGVWGADLRLGWTVPLSSRAASVPGTSPRAKRGGPEVGVSVAVYNLLNQTQFAGFNGVLTSPLFGQPISAGNPRRIDVTLRAGF